MEQEQDWLGLCKTVLLECSILSAELPHVSSGTRVNVYILAQ